MSDEELIRRGDALAAVRVSDFRCDAETAIAALPAFTAGVKPLVWRPAYDGAGQQLAVTMADCPALQVRYYAERPEDQPRVEAKRTARILAALEPVAAPAVTVGVKPDRETFDAMCAMRDAINEFVPMPSLESDLLQGPENSVFCATVAEAVIAEIRRLRAALEPVAAPDPAAIREAIKASVGECLAGLIHAEVSKDARRKIERAIDNTLIPTKGPADDRA